MRLKLAVATLALLSFPVGSAMAEDTFWRNVITSGATTSWSSPLKTTPAASSPAKAASAARIWKPQYRKSAPTTRVYRPPTWNWPTLFWRRMPLLKSDLLLGRIENAAPSSGIFLS